MANATAIKDAVEVITHGVVEGTYYIVTSCADYDDYRTLPVAVRFEGREYVKTGWNSDKNVAYYQTGRSYAAGVR